MSKFHDPDTGRKFHFVVKVFVLFCFFKLKLDVSTCEPYTQVASWFP